MPDPKRSFDGRLPAIWAVLLTVSLLAQTYIQIADEARRGYAMGFGQGLALQATSHLVIAALLPVLYWLHRRWPVDGGWRNLLIHAAAVVPFSLAHTLGMAALRLLWFNAIRGEAYAFPLSADRFAYEGAKDLISYGMLSVGVVVFGRLLRRAPTPPPERFAVRKRGGTEVMVEVADIDWIEAAGNYAILHVGDETFEIRSSLTKLESELDPKRFVRVHKSHMVNIARVTEVVPWVSGDWRIRLNGGAEVNLSRRYRERFEALAPVRT